MSFWSRSYPIPQNMADLHCHVIPGLDDGAETIEESLAMLRLLQEIGFRVVAATTHLRHPYWEERQAEQILTGLQSLQEVLRQQTDLTIQVVAGAEIYCGSEFLTLLDQDQLISLNHGIYLLIEFPPTDPLWYVKDIIFALRLRGLWPVLAHPERYNAVQQKPELAEEWVQAGALLQLDLPSMLGANGPGVRRLAHRLLKSHLFHLAATDLHHLPAKTSHLRTMFKNLIKVAGEHEANRLLRENPHRILQGRDVLEFPSSP